jgi:CNT family concentrative nucleoside transporter
MIGLIGLAALYGIAYLLSDNRGAVSLKLIAWGFGLQLAFALLILRTEWGGALFTTIGDGVRALLVFADQGSLFVFGEAADPGGDLGMVFAFRVLPIVIFISSLFSVLYYLGVMQRVVLLMAKGMHRLMGVSGSESLAAAANVFMGQTEAPIIVSPYIPAMTRSELMALMTSGMATVSGAVLGAYIALGVRPEYLLSASVMAAPASLVMAKLLIPETEESKTAGTVTIDVEPTDVNIIDSAARGAGQGITLALNIGGMLIAFIAIIYLIDGILAAVGNAFVSRQNLAILIASLAALTAAYVLGWNPRPRTRGIVLASAAVAALAAVVTYSLRGGVPLELGLESILATVFAPLAFVMGVPWSEAFTVGQLFGIKLMLNEFVAYTELSGLLAEGALSPKSELIASYALCGFANFSSIGIQIGGIGGLAPSRRSDLARLGLRSVLGGMLASFTVATLAGIMSGF